MNGKESTPLTYRQLLEMLNGMPEENLDDTATVHLSNENEFHPVQSCFPVGAGNSVMDEGHYIMQLE